MGQTTPATNTFERHKKKTLLVTTLIVLALLVMAAELILGKVMGLGDPVLYDTYPVYGYRPLPSRSYTRFGGAEIKFNNLGLRAEADWDEDPTGKVLFLGDSVTYGGSYIANDELFSHLAAERLGDGVTSGNAGVNAWGVENIHGLVVESDFTPAEIYVTTLPERDFYRGLVRLQGLPFYNTDPKFALEELWRHLCYKANNKRYQRWQDVVDDEAKAEVVERAVIKLKEMDGVLKAQGHEHLILITPGREQVTEGAARDAMVEGLLAKHGIDVHYVIDDVNALELSAEEKAALFHDGIHLSKVGHERWAEIIAAKLETLPAE